MAATIFGIGEISPQPGFSARQSEQGGWVASHEFAIRADNFDSAQSSFVKGTLLADLDPSIPEPFSSFLKIVDTEISRVEGDLIFLRVTASGADYPQYDGDELSPENEPTYTLTGQLTDAPFSSHPKWKELTNIEKTTLGKMIDGLLTYDIEENVVYYANQDKSYIHQFEPETDGLEFAVRIQQGQTTYLKSSYTWQESSEGNEMLPNAQLNKLGLIATPRGEPPLAEGTRDWMLTNVSQSQTGELYRTNLEWTLSENGGFDDFLYNPTQQ